MYLYPNNVRKYTHTEGKRFLFHFEVTRVPCRRVCACGCCTAPPALATRAAAASFPASGTSAWFWLCVSRPWKAQLCLRGRALAGGAGASVEASNSLRVDRSGVSGCFSCTVCRAGRGVFPPGAVTGPFLPVRAVASAQSWTQVWTEAGGLYSVKNADPESCQ